MKNITPLRIALITAAITAFFVLALMVLQQRFFSASFWFNIGVVLLVFLIAYFLFYYALEVFIYRKIKLIYKTIYNLKTEKNTGQRRVALNSDIISEVNQQVLDWAENQQMEMESLRKQESFRREFLGNVSHELKTPLFNIQGYIHTLLDTDLEDAHIHRLYSLEKAARNVERLCAIVDDLESISKIESGEMTLELRNFDIHEMVKDVFDSIELAKQKNIALDFKEGCDRAFFVQADKERIRQVIVNLVVNSIKYGKNGGKTQVGFYDMHENILVEISDNGIGIDLKDLPRVFERFYRVDKSRSRDQGGTGLGLAIVKHIVEAHQQTINVRSTTGVGSTFGFTLKKG